MLSGTSMKRMATVGAAALMLTVVAACSSGGSSSGDAAAAGGGASCDLTAVNAALDKYSAVPEYKEPGPAFDMSKAAGKTIFNIQESSANPFTQALTTSMTQAAEKVGMKVVDYPNQGDHTQWIQGMNAAIAQKPDAITLTGGTISPTYFQPQAAAAKAAGIPIITVLNEDLTQPQGPEVTARVAQPYDLAARLSADFVIKDTNCAGNVLVLTSKEVIGSPASIDAINDEFKKYCPNCKLTFQNVSVPDWSTQITNIVRSAIQTDPNLNYVVPLYDSMSQFVVPGIQLAGATGKVHISTFNGTPFVLKMMQDADVVRMDVGENPAQVGYAVVDQVGRIISGAGPIASGDEGIQLRVFTKTNVAEAGNPPELGKGYGDSFADSYLKLWGKAAG
ncbi:ABC-type sugar transport system periplasmic component-like protein [Pseudonocardia dioxanivorans CB1190]|uniref:ABC-type sugar transport system periplasmic component-like protein n=1 Tax=Pseudonocardia dioxanivorans (strain ATCC 55486 / DSM 44775 / JCM 13855 / CB1190) TaxID=675635 RepID=F4CUM1_PSEUX|nr:sugar ABC transporter substrate-binding protein [Pseudonocardia dioxanivorans]AEA26335.1 ABC-type sugar transport system periplasmic component-like protein [Pseudonocardia dioxanivorans CB1190]GJF03190.1 sugar ABC transporter substrate-binding protein [Pseudonocardia sp. D17]